MNGKQPGIVISGDTAKSALQWGAVGAGALAALGGIIVFIADQSTGLLASGALYFVVGVIAVVLGMRVRAGTARLTEALGLAAVMAVITFVSVATGGGVTGLWLLILPAAVAVLAWVALGGRTVRG